MNAWLTLYKKELRASRFAVVVFPLAIIAVALLGYLFSNRLPLGLPAAIVMMPLSVYHFLVIYQGFQTMKSEWNDRTIYLVNSLPVSGTVITSSKLGSIMTAFTINTLLSILCSVLLALPLIERSGNPIPAGFPWSVMITMGIKIYILFWLFNLSLAVMGQFAYLSGKLVEKFSGLVSVISFAVSFWLIVRLGNLLAYGLEWLPKLRLQGINMSNGLVTVNSAAMDMSSFVGGFIVIIGLFVISSLLLEHEVEV